MPKPNLSTSAGATAGTTEEVKGVAIVELQAGGGYPVVSDADVSLLHVYDLASHVHLGAVQGGRGRFDRRCR